MKRINKRKCVWGMLTVGTLSINAFSDHPAFGNVTSAETVTVEEKSNSKEEAWKLLLTDESKYGKTLSIKSNGQISELSAGAASLDFEDKTETVLLNADGNNMIKEVTLETMRIPMVTIQSTTQEAAEVQPEQPVSPWANKAMAKVEDEVNVRSMPSQEAELAGKLRKGDEADVVEAGEEWTLITSGNVTGYVKNEFLVFGDEAENLAGQLGKKVATVQVETLNVRKQPTQEAGIYTQADIGKEFTCGAEENGWVSVTLSSGETGYVDAQYVTTEFRLGKAVTIEEEQAAIRAKQEAEEKAERERAEKEAKEAKAKAEKEQAAKAQKAAAKESSSQSESRQASANTAVQANTDDLTLLAAVIELEAGTHYEGGIAVANVVLNRVNSSRFPNSISGVVYQKGQFPGAHNGKLARILARGPKSACYQSAQAALNGENVAGNRLFFNSQRSINYNRVSNYIIVGGNCFY